MRRGEDDMRYLFASLMLSLLLLAGGTLPAAAQSWEGQTRRADAARPHHQRLARASYSDVYDSDEARPRRRSYTRHDGRSRHAARRHARVAKHMRRHQRTARKPGISRSKTVH